MASNSGSSYGNYNPAAVDPYPIESTLAAEAVKGNPRANTMLDLYQLQRQANSNIYGQELDTQHDFNRQQLANQLKEAYLKAGPEYLKEAGGGDLLASIPEYANSLGLTPEALAQSVGRSNQAHAITNLKNLGEGGLAFSSAGMPIPEQAMQSMTGLPFKQGERPDVQIGARHDAARMAAASMHASGEKLPGESAQITNEFGKPATVSKPKTWSDKRFSDYLKTRGEVEPDSSARPNQVAIPDAAAPATQTTPVPSAPTSGTRLQPNAPARKQSNTAAGMSAESRQFADFLDKTPNIPPETKAEIKQSMVNNGGKPPVAKNPATGRIGILRPDGKTFY